MLAWVPFHAIFSFSGLIKNCIRFLYRSKGPCDVFDPWVAEIVAIVGMGSKPTKENRHFFGIFWIFFGPWRKLPQMAPNRAGRICFLLIQTLSTFWAERILILTCFIFLIFWIPNFQISRFQISRNLAWAGLGLGPGFGLGQAWAGRAGEPLGWAGWAL